MNGEVLRIYQGVPGNREWVEDYVYANGRPLARIRNDAGSESVEYLQLDHLGSVRKVTDEFAAEVSADNFFPFGEETASASPGDSKLKFTGHERDDGSGTSDELDYMHARFCGPRLGRFLSVDPIGGNKVVPTSWNLYSYALNNPVAYVDPDGEDVVLFARDDSAGGSTNFGHTALRVFGEGYDYTFDFGRYRGAHGMFRANGPGILRVWASYENFVKNQQKRGAGAGAQYATPEEFDRAVIAYFEKLIEDGTLLLQTGYYHEYNLEQEYDLESNNCATIAMAGLAQGCGVIEGQFNQALEELIERIEAGDFNTKQLNVDTIDPRKLFAHLDGSRGEPPQGVVIYYYSYNPPE